MICFFFTTFYEYKYADLYLLVPGVVALVLIYVFHYQIDEWWWRRYPPGLDPAMKQWLATYSPFYQSLNDFEKDLFDSRISVFIHLKSFTLKKKKDYEVPEDIKIIIAHEYIRITLYRESYQMEHFNQFILYAHPFASPQFPFLHTLEIFFEDGVIILSLEQLANGFNKRTGHLNLGLFAAVSTFIMLNPRLKYPDLHDLNETDFFNSFGIDMAVIKTTLGFDHVNKLNVLIYCYFEYPETFIKVHPTDFALLEILFKKTLTK